MQRAPFVPQPAHSPPLHHPVPQHVSTVPMMRSPPPPAQQQPQVNNYGNPYQPAPPQGNMGNNFGPNFGGFINDPTAQMGFQVGKSAVMAGQEYMEQNLNRYVSIPALKHYFNVSNSYVLRKLALILFPWRHKPWNRQQARVATSTGADGQLAQQQYASMYLPPRDDINSPDMYIPIMAFITYILVSTTLAGLRGKFQPELLGSIGASAFIVVIVEIIILKVAMYILNISNDSQLLDLVAYSGYKFVGAIVTLTISEIVSGGKGTGGIVGWTVFLYTFLANALFLLRSLKYVLLPDSSNDVAMRSGASYTQGRAQRNTRTQFLFVYAYVIQLILMWILCRDESAVTTMASTVKGS